MGKNIVLVGLMGAGKTTVGKYLAEKYKMDFIDTDEIIEAQEKTSISDIFAKYGENVFRKIEAKIIKKISEQNNKIISTGGGVIENAENINNLEKNGVLVYLKASAEVLYERIRNQNTRPLLQNDNPLKTLQWLLQKREKNYMKADIIIDTENKSVAEIAQEVSTLCRL